MSNNKEIVLGALLATGFWAVVAGFSNGHIPANAATIAFPVFLALVGALIFYIFTIGPPGEHPAVRIREWSKIVIPAAALIVACAAAYWAWQQFELARTSAERQQRAYVMHAAAGAYDVENGLIPRTTVWLKNFGQTPALNVTAQQSITVSKYPRVQPASIKYQPQPNYLVNIPPGQESLIDNSLGRSLSAEELEGMQSGTVAIYLDVLITYEDAFHIPRSTTLSFWRNNTINHSDSMADTGEGDVVK